MGIPLFGVTSLARPAHYQNYLNWIAESKHAGMKYMAREDSVWKREDPHRIMDSAKSLLVFGFPYPSPVGYQYSDSSKPQGKVASYAWGIDYHDVLPPVLELLLQKIEKIVNKRMNYRILTDSAPILEKDYAQSAGLGWMGRNSCLISPQIGSFFFLAEILSDLEIEPTPRFDPELCGNCQRCIQACPTQCISKKDRTINAGECISYLTIENKKEIPRHLRNAIGSWVFGCDICQVVCPWNIQAPKHRSFSLFEQSSHTSIDLHETVHFSESDFNHYFAKSPILRAKRNGFFRNLACVLGNIRDPDSIPYLADLLVSEADPIIRAHAAWALGQYSTSKTRFILSNALNSELDPVVRDEIKLDLEE